jgi:Tfp pilus assembly protein PilF
VEILNLAASAWQAHAAGKAQAAVRLMRAAANREATIAKTVAMENPLVPMRELLAEMFLAQNDPASALREFEASLTSAPNRFRSFAGATEAAKRLGDLAAAKRYSQKLVELASFADSERPELTVARQLLAEK